MQVHPDKNPAPNSEEAFKRISAAYACLSDPEKKRTYDLSGSDDSNLFSTDSGRGQGGFGQQYYSYSFGGADFNPDDFIRAFFGGGFGPESFTRQRSSRRRPRRPQQSQNQEQSQPQNKGLVYLIQIIPLILLFFSFFGNLFVSVIVFLQDSLLFSEKKQRTQYFTKN